MYHTKYLKILSAKIYILKCQNSFVVKITILTDRIFTFFQNVYMFCLVHSPYAYCEQQKNVDIRNINLKNLNRSFVQFLSKVLQKTGLYKNAAYLRLLS